MPALTLTLSRSTGRGNQSARGLQSLAVSGRKRRGRRLDQLRVDSQQFVDPVSARVAGEDRVVPVHRELPGGRGVADQRAEVLAHLSTIAGDEVVEAGGEEALGVVPGGA